MSKAHRVSSLCLAFSFLALHPAVFAQTDAKSPDLGSGQIGGCVDELCAEEIFRSEDVSRVCIRIDARNGGLPSLKVEKGNQSQVIADWTEVVARTLCVRASSVTLQCLPAGGADAICLYRIVQIQ
jgi:hypothetical protein